MTALTSFRSIQQRAGLLFSGPVAAGVKIFNGAMVALDANGNFTPGATATTLTGWGVARAEADNSGGADGDISATIEMGIFPFENSAAGDQITRADIGSDAYIVDDQTVAKTDGGATRSVAGKIMDIDDFGVWIKFD